MNVSVWPYPSFVGNLQVVFVINCLVLYVWYMYYMVVHSLYAINLGYFFSELVDPCKTNFFLHNISYVLIYKEY